MKKQDKKSSHCQRRLRKLKQVLSWAKYRHTTFSNNDWTSFRAEDLDIFLAEVAPHLDSTGTTTTRDATSKFQSNIKLDVKSYPTFDGKIGSWLSFKRGVLSIASTHDLDCIFDPSFQVPEEGKGQDWLLYAAKNKFVYSMWSARVFGSYPLTIIRQHEKSKDGRAVFLDFLNHYESTNNLEQASLLAMNRLQVSKVGKIS